jgi:hypothetical protein
MVLTPRFVPSCLMLTPRQAILFLPVLQFMCCIKFWFCPVSIFSFLFHKTDLDTLFLLLHIPFLVGLQRKHCFPNDSYKSILGEDYRQEYLRSAASNTIPFVIDASAILCPHSEIHTTVQMGNCPNQF